MLLMLIGFAYFYKQQSLYDAFGFHSAQPTFIGLLIVFQFIFAPYNELIGTMMTVWTRSKEFAADAFSARLGYDDLLCAALTKLQKDNLAFPVHDWLYSWLHHDHPPLLERLRAIREMKQK